MHIPDPPRSSVVRRLPRRLVGDLMISGSVRDPTYFKRSTPIGGSLRLRTERLRTSEVRSSARAVRRWPVRASSGDRLLRRLFTGATCATLPGRPLRGAKRPGRSSVRAVRPDRCVPTSCTTGRELTWSRRRDGPAEPWCRAERWSPPATIPRRASFDRRRGPRTFSGTRCHSSTSMRSRSSSGPGDRIDSTGTSGADDPRSRPVGESSHHHLARSEHRLSSHGQGTGAGDGVNASCTTRITLARFPLRSGEPAEPRRQRPTRTLHPYRDEPEVVEEVAWEHGAVDEEALLDRLPLWVAVRERLPSPSPPVARLPDGGRSRSFRPTPRLLRRSTSTSTARHPPTGDRLVGLRPSERGEQDQYWSVPSSLRSSSR